MISELLSKASSVGSGILVYKLLDKYVDPNPAIVMPWKAMIPQLEASNTVGFADFIITMLAQKYAVRSATVREWLLVHGIAAGVSALIGLWMTPAMFVISGPSGYAPQIPRQLPVAPSSGIF